MSKFEGWVGGRYDDAGLFETKEDAARGMFPDDEAFYEIFSEYDGKKIKISIEVIDE